ncbi:MAG: ammonium transporter [Deltaproteobacteria bacterium]|nr:ammonium transporter [Deltaproteobacteria bacterium]
MTRQVETAEAGGRRRPQATVAAAVLIGLVAVAQLAVAASDPGGAATGGIADVGAVAAGRPTLDEVAATAGHNKIAINFIWTLFAGFLVMFMQAGFALVETGFTRAKNAAETMTMNFVVYVIGMTGYWVCGYALQMGGVGAVAALGGTAPLDSEFTISLFGKDFGLFGTKGFFLSGDSYDVGVFALFLFQMVFMDTAATIPTGSMAERWKFGNFCVFAFFMSMLVYPLFANWVWGGGWLATLGKNFGLGHGHVDFAGSSVVHAVGGAAALAGALVLGPRIGKYTRDGKATAIPGHDLPMALLGTFVLAFGWFGFNAGSTLAGTDLRISVVAVNTMLASASGALVAMAYMWRTTGKPDPSMTANGMLAGLVAITAPCAFVTSVSAFVIGGIAGLLVCLAVLFIDQRLRIDDPVGAISVHGVNGIWGVLSLGIFADGTYGDGWNGVSGPVRGLLYGDASQLVAQGIGAVTCVVFVFGAFYAFFSVCDAIWGIRVSEETEIEGLDLPEVGTLAYPDFNVASYEPAGSILRAV